MGILGLGSAKAKSASKASKKSKTSKSASKNREAQAVLKKMQAKKDAGDCAFC